MERKREGEGERDPLAVIEDSRATGRMNDDRFVRASSASRTFARDLLEFSRKPNPRK